MTRPRVLIIGAGFVGLNAAKALKRAPVDVLLVDQHNYHTFQPLLYQVATAGLAIDDIAHQVRDVFRRQKNFRFRQGTVIGVDWQAKRVQLRDDSELAFDYLILGAGAVYNDFGTPGVRDHAFFLKSLSEATNIRSHILRQFERASAHPEHRDDGSLTFVIVGGGPTGAEMAGTLAELFERVLPSDYPELDLTRARIVVVEMLDGLLKAFSEPAQRYTARVLAKRGVELRFETAVEAVFEDRVILSDGEALPTRTVIWAAGVRGHPLVEALGVELARGYRVAVEENLALPGKPYAFAAGDLSGAVDEAGRPYPQVAQVAIQQGKHASHEIVRQLQGAATRPFRYVDLGIMAIIGRNAGVAELSRTLGGFRMRGFLGWLGWLFIHLVYLPGHQNRFNAFATWTYNYVTFDRHARLITEMEPSPAEVAGHTSALVSPEAIVADRRAQMAREAAGAEGRSGA
jgi:NADH dehydrogenase